MKDIFLATVYILPRAFKWVTLCLLVVLFIVVVVHFIEILK